MEDETMKPPVGASVWESELFSYLIDHTKNEGKILEEYVSVAETTDSKALAYLINLLVEDERRHHRYFTELASSLKTEAELTRADPVIPRLDLDQVDSADLLEVTHRLLKHERADAKELKRLQKELHDLQHTTLWVILVEIMKHDTDKHIAILKFVADNARPKRR
ncbi:MAG: hypothetical protein R8G01_19935 [Ilumatobacteraceae bacterium]|nr:hypothetical protein [Ilumatobacteraceae bacterium]